MVAAAGGIAMASDTAAAPKTIKACYKPAQSPEPLSFRRRQHVLPRQRQDPDLEHSRPEGAEGAEGARGRARRQGVPGPQGPAGDSAGVSADSQTGVSLKDNSAATVLQAPAVQVGGVYYVSASAEIDVAQGDEVACNLSDVSGSENGIVFDDGPFSAPSIVTVPITGTLDLAAGDAPTVVCFDGTARSTLSSMQAP